MQVELTRTEYADKRFDNYQPTLINDMPDDMLTDIFQWSIVFRISPKMWPLVNWTVHNCMHPGLFYMSVHLKVSFIFCVMHNAQQVYMDIDLQLHVSICMQKSIYVSMYACWS